MRKIGSQIKVKHHREGITWCSTKVSSRTRSSSGFNFIFPHWLVTLTHVHDTRNLVFVKLPHPNYCPGRTGPGHCRSKGEYKCKTRSNRDHKLSGAHGTKKALTSAPVEECPCPGIHHAGVCSSHRDRNTATSPKRADRDRRSDEVEEPFDAY